MQIPWLTRPPTAEEVAAHAKAYPIAGYDGTGLWLCNSVSGASLFLLCVECGVVYMADRSFPIGARGGITWLPCTADGIPVCLLPAMAALADWTASVEKALEHLTEALEASSDWDDEPRDEVRKAHNLLAALGKP